MLSGSNLGKAIIAQVDDATHERQQREEAALNDEGNVEDEGVDDDSEEEHDIDERANPMARAAEVCRAAAAAAAAAIVAEDATPPLPEGWNVRVVNETGETYFQHVAAGMKQWTFPTEADCASAAATVAERVLAAAAVEIVSASADLPEGWAAVRDGDGNIYYYNATTRESSWEVPVELRHGWVKLMHEESGHAYFHHAASGLQLWSAPTDEDDARAREVVATEAAAAIQAEAAEATALRRLNKHARLDAKKKKADRAALASSTAEATALRLALAMERSDAGRAKRDATLAAEAARLEKIKRGKKKVRWKWSAKMETTLASALLGTMTGGKDGDHSAGGGTPEYLSDVFATLFKDADRNGDGELSTVELMMMIDRRAKKTALAGNSHAIFKLKEVLHKQAEHDDITELEWEKGLVAVMRADESGPVAEWIMRELQTLARQWKEVARRADGALYYSHRTLGKTWTKPPVVSAMEHFEALRSGTVDPEVRMLESSGSDSSSGSSSSGDSSDSGESSGEEYEPPTQTHAVGFV